MRFRPLRRTYIGETQAYSSREPQEGTGAIRFHIQILGRLKRVTMSLVLASLDRAIRHGQRAIPGERPRQSRLRTCRCSPAREYWWSHRQACKPPLERIRQPLGLGHDRNSAVGDGRRQIRKRRPRHELSIAGNPARPDRAPLRRPGHEAHGNRLDQRQLRRRHLAVGGQRRDAIGLALLRQRNGILHRRQVGRRHLALRIQRRHAVGRATLITGR